MKEPGSSMTDGGAVGSPRASLRDGRARSDGGCVRHLPGGVRARARIRIALYFVAACLPLLCAPAWALPAAGARAPRFALRELRDKSVLVTSTGLLAGRTTLLSFFATWCKPCKEEIPELRRLTQNHEGKGFQVVLVCLDRMGARNVENYLAEADAGPLPVLWDKFGHTKDAFGVLQLPSNVLVGPDETVLLSWEGYLPERIRELERRLQSLVAGAQAGQPKEAQ